MRSLGIVLSVLAASAAVWIELGEQFDRDPLRAKKEFLQGLEQARLASLEECGLPTFIPETRSDWLKFCRGWPAHRSCRVMQETGYPFSKDHVAAQCQFEETIWAENSEARYGPEVGARLEWSRFDDALTAELVCAAYGRKL